MDGITKTQCSSVVTICAIQVKYCRCLESSGQGKKETMVPAASSGAVSGSSSSFSVPSPVTSGPSGSSVGRSAFPVIQWAPYTAREPEGVPEPVIQWGEFERIQKNVINF